MKHYGCMVDPFGCSSEPEKAQRFLTEMPMRPDPITQRTLLGACKIPSNLTLGEIATKNLLGLDPMNSRNYVMLSNTSNMWDNDMKVRETLADTDVEEIPGCNSNEVSNLEGEFIAAKVPLLTKNPFAVV